MIEAGKYWGRFPQELGGPRRVGLEREFPVVKRDGTAFDVRETLADLVMLGWEPHYDDHYQGELQMVSRDGFQVTTDAGWCTLEINLPPYRDLWKAREEFEKLMMFLVEVIGERGGLVLGYGIQPITKYSDNLWIRKRRHEIVRMNFPKTVNRVTITAANQIHIDIARPEVIPMTNVMNALAGLLIVLCANSPIWAGRIDPKNRLAVREDLWRFSNHGRIGIPYEQFEDLSHFLRYVFQQRFFVSRKEGGEYFKPGVTFGEYIQGDGVDFTQHYKYHEGTVWFCARPRTVYGTIEIRPCCSQPPEEEENMAADALALGLVENLKETSEIVSRFPWEVWRRLREDAIFYGFQATVEGQSVLPLLEKILDLAKRGLAKRGFGEELFLAPLYQRLECQQNPAHNAINLFQRGGIPALIEKLAYRF